METPVLRGMARGKLALEVRGAGGVPRAWVSRADPEVGRTLLLMDFGKLSRTQCFLLDMDGTFYLGDDLLPGALEFIDLLRHRGTEFLFLTNNSSRSRDDCVSKLAKLGLSIDEGRIFTSGEATTIYLSRRMAGARVFLAGTSSLEREFRTAGFELVQGTECDVVVLGFDTTLTYAKLWRLCDLVRSGVPYVATHPDINCPTAEGFMPDIGAMIEFIATSTGRRPDTIVGKPHQPIVDALVEKTQLPVSAICMVGDRLYTDIALGKTGIATVLVLSGETSSEDLTDSDFRPDYVMEHLAELAEALAAEG